MNRIVNGFRVLPWGFRQILKRKELFMTVLPPVMINLLLFFLLGWALVHVASGWVALSLGVAWYAVLASILLSLGIVAVLVFVFLALFAAITGIIGAPFYDALADRLMKGSASLTDRNVFQDIGFSIKTELKKVGVFAAVHFALLLLHLLPGIGSVIYAALGFIFTVFFLGFLYLDYAFSRTDLKLSGRIKWSRKYLPEVFGFGLAIFIAFLVPVLNAFMIPAAVAGGVTLFRGLDHM